MRKELELMQLIENYLKGNLSEADTRAFEKRMSTDKELQKEVELQSDLMKGIERAGLKQSASTAFKKYKFKKNLKNWGLGGLTVTIIALSSVLLYTSLQRPKENAAQPLPELNEQGEKLWSDADKYLPLQNFELDTEKDTVVETADGIVIVIPAHSFLTAAGQPATGTINLEVKEALHASDIMKAGLTTKSGDQLLETGGMFYINARKDGASLKIDPKNGLRAQIPTNDVKPGMQLFEGKRMPDGSIDWVNPKPIVKDLVPVDILSLNFYPPDYLDSLRSWGYNDKDKKFTDSLYYSFAAHWEPVMSLGEQDRSITSSEADGVLKGLRLFKQHCASCHSMGSEKITGPGLLGVTSRVPGGDWLHEYIKNNEKMVKSGEPYATKVSRFSETQMTIFESTLNDEDIDVIIDFIKNNDNTNSNSDFYEGEVAGINPTKIKAIWDKHFQNTLLSTKEFEERLAVIHQTCDKDVLGFYVKHLDLNMSTIDSAIGFSPGMTTSPLRSKFQEFAARGDGKVKNGDKNVELLKKYYLEKSKIYTEAISKTRNDFWKKQRELDQETSKKQEEHLEKDNERIVENYKKELDINLTEAYRQLGKEKPTPIPTGTYGVSINTTGWNNVDKYVVESLNARSTLDYTDPDTGKKAVIKYEAISVTVNDYKNYDRVLVYLLPDKFNSFMRVKNKNEVFEEKVTNLMTYKLVCIAYKDEESFYYSQDNIKPGSISVSLIKTTNADIQNNVNKFGKMGQVKAMNDELKYEAFKKQEAKRQTELLQLKELTDKTRVVIFPCMIVQKDSTARAVNEATSKAKMDSLFSAAAAAVTK
jgi:mono/diheme cytochrome c family protein